MRIYTRTGDKGTTGLYSGQRLPKTHFVFEALGANDELSSHLGLAIEHCRALPDLVGRLQQIQGCIQDVNGHIATPRNTTETTVAKIGKSPTMIT